MTLMKMKAEYNQLRQLSKYYNDCRNYTKANSLSYQANKVLAQIRKKEKEDNEKMVTHTIC